MKCTFCLGHLEDDASFCGHCGRRTRKRRDSILGQLVDDTYRIDEKLAAGGFGAIYRATHVPSGVNLALKILHADFAGDPALTGRFLRESKALAKLRNPHTVITYERGEARDGTLYIAMELLEGESLQERMKKRGPMPWREVLVMMRAVCASLAEAHAAGIVHRDLKPANIHLGANDFVKVLDFGVAKLLPWSGIDDGTELTLAGQAVGTLEYMAPEQLSGAPCDARTDIFALGVVAYEMMTGRRPFQEASTPAALITALFTETVPVPSALKQNLPPAIDQLLLRCLEREPGDRFASVVELGQVIERILSAARTPAPRANDATGASPPSPTRACADVQAHAAEPRHLAIAPTIAYTLPVSEPRRRRSSLFPAFDGEVRGSVVEVSPYPADPEPTPAREQPAIAPTTVIARRSTQPRWWILALGFALGIASVAAVIALS